MKVERKTESKFEPITITIETEDEAKLMWVLLNTSSEEIERKCNLSHVPCNGTISQSMWSSFNKIYDPRK